MRRIESTILITGALPTGFQYSGENRPKTPEKVQDQASRLRGMVTVPVIGSTRHEGLMPPSPSAPMATPTQPLAAAPARLCPLVAVTSGKGGVGKTSLCVNLSIALSQRKHRVTLLDADLGMANADVMCGMTPTTRLDSAVYPTDRRGPRRVRTLAQIAVEAPGGFRLVPGSVGVTRMANLPAIERDAMLAGLVELERDSDLVLIDTGAGLSDGVTSFVTAADLVAVVVTPEPTSIADAYALIKCVSTMRGQRGDVGRDKFVLIVNQVRARGEGEMVHKRIGATCKKFLGFEPPLLGVVHADEAIPASVKRRKPVMLDQPQSKVSREIAQVAGALSLAAGVKTPQAPDRVVRRRLFGWLRSR